MSEEDREGGREGVGEGIREGEKEEGSEGVGEGGGVRGTLSDRVAWSQATIILSVYYVFVLMVRQSSNQNADLLFVCHSLLLHYSAPLPRIMLASLH